MSTFLGITVLISLAFMVALLSSRHILDVAIRLLTAHRAGVRAYHDERVRVLKNERLQLTVMR